MEAGKKDSAIRKRQLIQDSARKMFLGCWNFGTDWLCACHIVVFVPADCLQEKESLAAKAATISTLKKVTRLHRSFADNVRVLNRTAR